MKIISFIVITMSILFACSPMKKEEGIIAEDTILDQADAKAQLAAVPSGDLYSDGKGRLIKTVNYRFEVENVKKSTEAIEIAVKNFPAYISSSNLRLENPILENKISIRVQSEYFHELLKVIDQHAKFVNFRDVKTDDVAKEFVDLESRLKTKREVEERYTAILRNKAGTIEEIFDAEEQIGKLHEEIEATISRINYLKEQVSYSTINLEFYQTIDQQLTASDQITWKDRFTRALVAGWEGVLTIGIALAFIWPLLFLAGVAIISYRYFKRKIRIV